MVRRVGQYPQSQIGDAYDRVPLAERELSSDLFNGDLKAST